MVVPEGVYSLGSQQALTVGRGQHVNPAAYLTTPRSGAGHNFTWTERCLATETAKLLQYEHEARSKCPPPCETLSYSISQAGSPWPGLERESAVGWMKLLATSLGYPDNPTGSRRHRRHIRLLTCAPSGLSARSVVWGVSVLTACELIELNCLPGRGSANSRLLRGAQSKVQVQQGGCFIRFSLPPPRPRPPTSPEMNPTVQSASKKTINL
uniref:Uncharacterized protein n=1 Tax=Macrostomum lignano TaxID=282301 RepID=A0A1I8FPR4_9PLAT